MSRKAKGKTFPEKAGLVSANKAALKDCAQKIADRAMEELAEQGPEIAGLIRKYQMSIEVRGFTYVKTDKDGTEYFNIPLSVKAVLPVALVTRPRTYKLVFREEDSSREDWGRFPGPAILRYLDDKLSESSFSGDVRDLAAGILEKLSLKDESVLRDFQIHRAAGPGMDAAVRSVTAPGNEEKYRKTAEDRFRELCLGSHCACRSGSAVHLQLEDVSIFFWWSRKKGRITVEGEFRYSRAGGENISARSRGVLRVSSLVGPLAEAEDIVPALKRNLQDSAAELAGKQYEEVSLVYSDRDDPDLPGSLRELLSMGNEANRYVTGSVIFSRRGDSSSRAAPAYVIWGKKPLLACGEPPLLRPVREINWQEALDADICPYSIDGPDLPEDLYEFAGFISQARDLYDGMETVPGLPEKPAVAFEFDEDHPEAFMDNMDYCRGTVRDNLVFTFREIMRTVYDRMQYTDSHPEVLSGAGLTGAELAILEHIYQNGGQSASSVARLETDPMMTQDALKAGLERLSGMSVMLPDGKLVPLLRKKTERIRKYDLTYTAYYPHRAVPEELLSRIPLREYTFSDIESFAPPVRDEWRARLMAAAGAGGREARWEALTCFEGFPKKFRARYIKTEEGQEFFAAFEGNDAIYAELVLSGIPGGKTLAKKLYAEKDTD